MNTRSLAAAAVLLVTALPLSAQWTNRYQRIGQGHHVYVVCPTSPDRLAASA